MVRDDRRQISFGEPACLGRDCQRRRFPAGDLVLTQGLEEFNYVTDESLNLGCLSICQAALAGSFSRCRWLRFSSASMVRQT